MWTDDFGNRALLSGKNARALAAFDVALTFEPQWGFLHEDRGRALLSYDPTAALAEFERADCGAPCVAEEGDALVRLGQLQAAGSKYVNARAVSRVADMALALAHAGKYAEALALERALANRLDAGFLERADLASTFATQGEIYVIVAGTKDRRQMQAYEQAAIKAFGQASQLAPFNEGYLLSYGYAQAQWGDPRKAIATFQRVLAIHPGQSDAQAALVRLQPDANNGNP
jgi:tetratricopeptide (TPR) repeat protein